MKDSMGQSSQEHDDQPLLDKESTSNATPTPNKSSQSTKDVGLWARGLAALFYATASIMIMLVNKQVLTGFKFPSFQVRNIKMHIFLL